jgi:predicted RNase H-like nuclease (RuvC/YqgF family)
MYKEEQKIIDLENEISFLKNALCEKQKEIEELKKENNEIWQHLPRLD